MHITCLSREEFLSLSSTKEKAPGRLELQTDSLRERADIIFKIGYSYLVLSWLPYAYVVSAQNKTIRRFILLHNV